VHQLLEIDEAASEDVSAIFIEKSGLLSVSGEKLIDLSA
jgi:hypothetical protein